MCYGSSVASFLCKPSSVRAPSAQAIKSVMLAQEESRRLRTGPSWPKGLSPHRCRRLSLKMLVFSLNSKGRKQCAGETFRRLCQCRLDILNGRPFGINGTVMSRLGELIQQRCWQGFGRFRGSSACAQNTTTWTRRCCLSVLSRRTPPLRLK